jgi:L-amino acid N-acyltransferase
MVEAPDCLLEIEIALWPAGTPAGIRPVTGRSTPHERRGLSSTLIPFCPARKVTPMKIIACSEQHSESIRAILNEAIIHSTAIYDYKERTAQQMQSWFETKRKGNFPIIGAQDDSGTLLGFASYGVFRAWPAYKYSVEHSVYVETRSRGRGIGRQLVLELIEAARQQDYHMLIGGIDASNQASIGLHRSLGFSHCASIKQAGFKFGRWLDLEFYQLLLPTPRSPADG